LDWLNQRTDRDTQFFGIVPEVIQIDDSKPVVQFNLIVFPNDWQKEPSPSPEKISEKQQKYKGFFQRLIDDLRDNHHFTNARKGQYQSWYAFSSGFSGITYGASFAFGDRVRVDLYIGTNKRDNNKNIFDSLFEDKDNIESEIGCELGWERLDDKAASRVAIYREGSIDSDDKEIADILKWSVDYILKFRAVLHERLEQAIENNN